MIFYFGLIILYKIIVDYFFKNHIELDTHTLFRSFFCFFISTLSIGFSIIYWNHLIYKPLEHAYLSIFINKLMLSYMMIDTFYIIFEKNIRIELIFHHLLCIGLYGYGWDKSLLSFCSIAEILSAFNWIGILYPKYDWSIKLFRLYAILFIRLEIWFFTLCVLSQYIFLYRIGFIFIIIFICLDCYWIWIIISNYLKYKNFIKQKIILNTNKILNTNLRQ